LIRKSEKPRENNPQRTDRVPHPHHYLASKAFDRNLRTATSPNYVRAYWGLEISPLQRKTSTSNSATVNAVVLTTTFRSLKSPSFAIHRRCVDGQSLAYGPRCLRQPTAKCILSTIHASSFAAFISASGFNSIGDCCKCFRGASVDELHPTTYLERRRHNTKDNSLYDPFVRGTQLHWFGSHSLDCRTERFPSVSEKSGIVIIHVG